jgi:hypothetical protein
MVNTYSLLARRPEAAYFLPLFSGTEPVDSAATKASCGTSTLPMVNTYSLLARRPEAAYFLPLFSGTEPVDSAATKASCGTSTLPIVFIRFLPSFCFSRSLRLREMSPP